MKRIYVVGTADTKGEELRFLCRTIRAEGREVVLVDVGTSLHDFEDGISAREVARHIPGGMRPDLESGDRGRAVAAMGAAFASFIRTRDDIAGIIGIGGGGGTSIVTAGIRELPFGLPKLVVSTLASGDTSPYVGVSDIVMMPAVTDLAGLNRISRVVLSQAAHAIAAMSEQNGDAEMDDRPALGLTMFGVTTTCVTAITGFQLGPHAGGHMPRHFLRTDPVFEIVRRCADVHEHRLSPLRADRPAEEAQFLALRVGGADDIDAFHAGPPCAVVLRIRLRIFETRVS